MLIALLGLLDLIYFYSMLLSLLTDSQSMVDIRLVIRFDGERDELMDALL